MPDVTAPIPTAGSTAAHASPALAEADRLITVCNSCRYCEGLCAVFPAMEMRRVFGDGDLRYLANLCHNCGACYDDCQFAPPHEFGVNVPRVLAQVRAESWARYAWPKAAFAHNGVWIALALAGSVAAFVGGFAAWTAPGALFAVHEGPGAFYRLMPHGAMAALFGAAFLFALAALGAGAVAFWRDSGGGGTDADAVARGARDAATLRYLDGGGGGCMLQHGRPPDRRRLYHHLTAYGFLLCALSTATATLFHYALGREAPYAWWELPVVLGTLGGAGLVAGPVGLFAAKLRQDPALRDSAQSGMEAGFTLMLLLTAVTGLALLLLRATPAMGVLLALHLGVVFALFVTMPYGKFVHGMYRGLALVRSARERR